jgi:outer membrane protein assembly factor BamD
MIFPDQKPMPSTPATVLRILSPFILCLGLFAGAARADLVWTPSTGWRIEGGVLSGLTGAEGRSALDMMNRARKDEEAGSTHGAIRNYEKVAKKYPSSVYAPEALYRVAEIRLKRRQYYKAFDAFQQIVARYPNEKRFDLINREQYHIASILLDGGRNRIWGWLPSFTNREKGLEYCAMIVANAPYGDYAPLALMDEARGFQYMGSSDEAIDTLDRMINSYPQSVLAPEAYLQLGQLHAALVQGPYYDQAETNQSIVYQQDFMILYPNDPKIAAAAKGLDDMKRMLAESKMMIGDFYFYKRSNYTAARVFYNEAITSYPDSEVAKRARAKLNDVEAKAARAANPSAAPAKKKHFLFF